MTRIKTEDAVALIRELVEDLANAVDALESFKISPYGGRDKMFDTLRKAKALIQ